MSGMSRGPAAPSMNKQKIKIQLKGREHGFYSNMWSIAAQENATLGGKEAVTFFKRSGVPVEKLK
jgi:hypothetical protein